MSKKSPVLPFRRKPKRPATITKRRPTETPGLAMTLSVDADAITKAIQLLRNRDKLKP